MEFEWDSDKARLNLRKHLVSFEEAATVFSDWFSVAVPDPDHSMDESRFIVLGLSSGRRLLMVAYTERGGRIRIMSARELTRNERKAFEKNPKTSN